MAAESEGPAREDRQSGRNRLDSEKRSEFERDVDRIYYNYYFRRLAEITQVSSDHHRVLRHNRMTHSLKVAQVARRLVQYLEKDKENEKGIVAAGGIDRNVVTAAGLLHDAGHPPFGHIGEMQLNNWARAHGLADGYEGNAQTLRIIVSLTAHQRGREELADGLDLTRAVVAACVKYPWSSEEAEEKGTRKWGYYEPEAEVFKNFVRPLLPAFQTCTLEAEIMDWADDITYAVHDLQDFYTDGVIPLHHLRHYQRDQDKDYAPIYNSEFHDYWQYTTEKLRQTSAEPSPVAYREFQKYANRFPEGPYTGSREEDAQVGALASQIITDASKKTSVKPDGRLYIDSSVRGVIDALKQVTWYYVIDHPELVTTQIGQRARVDEMCHRLLARVKFCYRQSDSRGNKLTQNEQWILRRRLPVRLREFVGQLLAANANDGTYRSRNLCFARAVVDYVASMTENEFDRMWDRMCPGERLASSDHRAQDNEFYRGEEGL